MTPATFIKLILTCALYSRVFYRKGVVAQKENHSHQKRPAFLMAMIERASVFIMIASDHDKNRAETRGLLIAIWRGIKTPAVS